MLTHENVLVLGGKRGKCAPLIRHSLGMFSEDKRRQRHTRSLKTQVAGAAVKPIDVCGSSILNRNHKRLWLTVIEQMN